jgi:1,4-dihydroxy-2-naphthoate octaprenyltransferase
MFCLLLSRIKFITGPMRVPFLPLAPVCVLLGIATAVGKVGRISLFSAFLALVGGVTAHMSVNALNEYADCVSGLDSRTRRTSFSGGSGVLPGQPEMAWVALITGLVALAITVVIGVCFAIQRGPGILPLGLAGVLVIIAYTPWLTRRPLWCLVAPGLGFGTLMVMGTHFVFTGQYSWTSFVASLVPFFLVNDLLLLNQFPDMEADRSVGRKHIPILLGPRRSSVIYGLFLAAAYLVILAGVGGGLLPKMSLLGLLTLPLAVPTVIGVYRHANEVPKLVPYLGLNVILNLATPVLVAIGFFAR